MVDLKHKLSTNFTLGEFLRSDTAEHDPALKTLQLNPTTEVISNLTYLARNVLQPLREMLGKPFNITSGYRSAELNSRIGGARTSQHCFGEATDCQLSASLRTDHYSHETCLKIEETFHARIGQSMRTDANTNFLLFALICLNLDNLPVDQLIHEHGEGNGRPAWIHISSTPRQCRREILVIGEQTQKNYLRISYRDALFFGVSS